MGPGCFHPRNRMSPSDPTQFVVLQWGRDVSIPEMPRCSTWWSTQHSFNGAGMFPSQKWSVGPPGTVTLTGFNGAGMFPSQKFGASLPRFQFCRRFNGAGMFPSQKFYFACAEDIQ